MKVLHFKATKNDEGRTLFKYLINQLNNVPISAIEKVFRIKDIKINGKKTNKKSYILIAGDEITIYGIEDHKVENYTKTNINFKVIYEDKNILAINKPINISMHGFEDSLDNQVLTYLNYNQSDSFKPSSIGRIDRSTSGLVIYAKTYKALVQLNQKTKDLEKYYLLKSDFPWEKKHVVVYGRKNNRTHKMEVFDVEPGFKMETIFFTDKNKKYAKILTGKKHQIRLTLNYLGFPIYGDKRYGGKYEKRVYLHSYKVIFKNLTDELEYLNDTQLICDIKW